jgi:hypothetical protein
VYFRPQLSSHVVLVTYNFRYLASAPGVRWRARAGALALGQEPKLLPQLAHTTTSPLGENGEEGRELEGGRRRDKRFQQGSLNLIRAFNSVLKFVTDFNSVLKTRTRRARSLRAGPHAGHRCALHGAVGVDPSTWCKWC